MLERFWVKQERENHFLACFVLSFAFAIMSIVIGYYFVPFQVGGQNFCGIIVVLLTSLTASYPLIRYLERREEKEEEEKDVSDMKLLERHFTELKIYLAFFLGVTAAFTISAYFLPESAFSIQSSVIGSITGKIISIGLFEQIITNNLSVFLLTFLISFVLTAGMVFILVWNASVLGVFFSEASKTLLGMPAVAVQYLPHGILEIAAYALAGISGFFLSHEAKDFLESDDKNKAFKLVQDSFLLFVIGLILLVVAGLLESISF